MKVLFISPKDPDEEEITNLKFLVGGENTYTCQLLKNPPPGVEYVQHAQALKEGKITYTNFQTPLSSLIELRILPPDAGIQSFEVRERFDLIHCHAYCLHLKNYSGPVILSDSSSNILFLKDYLGWGGNRIDVNYKLRGLISRKFNIYDPNLNLSRAKKLIVWSKFAKNIHEKLGCNPKKIVVIPPGIERLPAKKIKHKNFNILFIGIWFERKGGPLLLEAYRALKNKYPKIRLTLIGQVPKEEKLSRDIYHRDYLPREKLIREIFPYTDVLVLVPPVAEGYGLVVLEAASLGIPSIISSVCALPEIVENKKTGFIITPGRAEELLKKLKTLIENPIIKERMGKAAQTKFLRQFWIRETNKKLLRIYQEATGG